VVRFVGNPGLHQLKVCLPPTTSEEEEEEEEEGGGARSSGGSSSSSGGIADPLWPESCGCLSNVVVALRDTNHLAWPVKTSRPPLRLVHLPAPLLHLGKRRGELRHMRALLTSKVCVEKVSVLARASTE